MDFDAIQFASDSILEEYGLKAAGQRFSLRWFCKTKIQERSATGGSSIEPKEMRKRRLLEELRKMSKRNINEEHASNAHHSNTGKPGAGKTRKIQLGWMHYNDEKGKYVPVRLQSGGGTRDVSISVDANAEDIIKEAVKLFYPNGKSMCHGMASRMNLQLGNFKGELVQDNNSPANNGDEMFTLQNYIAKNKLSRVRIYLMSKEKTEEDQILEVYDSSSDEDFEHITMFSDETVHVNLPDEEMQTSGSSIDALCASVDEDSDSHTAISLYGKLNEPADELLDKQSRDDCNGAENYSKRIQTVRASRLLPEPDFTTTDAVIVAVRHIDLGVITRHFRCSETVTAVYDWVGSLQAEPVHFVLCNVLSPGHAIDP